MSGSSVAFLIVGMRSARILGLPEEMVGIAP
jgi:hypothetical protein